jgi:hypothetical protein
VSFRCGQDEGYQRLTGAKELGRFGFGDARDELLEYGKKVPGPVSELSVEPDH